VTSWAKEGGNWYSTARWKKKRAHQLAISPLCCMCQQMGRLTAATVADHVVPHKGNADLFWDGELQSLCRHCHDGAKRHLEATGKLRGSAVDGTPLDPNHHWNREG
jgi:5-methylcytosine-specific restriction endonuclease McrA